MRSRHYVVAVVSCAASRSGHTYNNTMKTVLNSLLYAESLSELHAHLSQGYSCCFLNEFKA